MADVEFQMSQLVTLAIGSPEVGAVNFNLLQKVLLEMLKLTDLDTAIVQLSEAEAAKFEAPEVHHVKDFPDEPERTSMRRSFQAHQCPISPEKVDQLLEDMAHLKFDVEDLTNKMATMSATADTVPFQEMRSSLSQVDVLQERIKTLEKTLEGTKDTSASGNENRNFSQRLTQLEKFAEKHEDQLEHLNSAVTGKLEDFGAHFDKLEKEMGELNEKVNVSPSIMSVQAKKSLTSERMSTAGDHHAQSSINNLIARLSSVQHDLDNLAMTVSDFSEEQERRQMVIDVLTEQIEILKLAKADKTNMEDSLAAKADMSQVHRKVSHDHFETKFDRLNNMVEDAFLRLDGHESMWQEEVEDLKVDIEHKLDKLEFVPLKDYVNEKLKTIQDKMKTLATQRRESLAAGTKKRVIRDVQCISCDNDSLMKTENTMEDMMPAPGLTTQQSVKPYLTYQLDQVRKQQKKLPQGRNLLHFEDMLNECIEKKNPKFPNTSRSGEHMANRYVGGSHTITTPQQRVTRTGNFFETWGPVITAVNMTRQSQSAV